MNTNNLIYYLAELTSIAEQLQNARSLTFEQAYQHQIDLAKVRYNIDILSLELNDAIIGKIKNQKEQEKLSKGLSFDPSIRSDSIDSSLSDNSKTYKAFSNKDYQVWILIHLLKKFGKYDNETDKIIALIRGFIAEYKDESFSYHDIVRLGAGAARCYSNLRFALNGLKVLGLINTSSKSIHLTFLGLIVAISLVQKPVTDSSPLGKKLEATKVKGSYLSVLDNSIYLRINNLSKIDFFNEVILADQDLSKKIEENAILKFGHEIFTNYYNILHYLKDRTGKKGREIVSQKIYEAFPFIDKKTLVKEFMTNWNYEKWLETKQ